MFRTRAKRSSRGRLPGGGCGGAPLFLRSCPYHWDGSQVIHNSQHDVRALAEHWNDRPEALAVVRDKVVNDPDPRVRKVAIASLLADCADAPDTFSLLLDRAIEDASPLVRTRALRALAKTWPGRESTVAALRRIAVTDAENGVRECAALELMRLCREETLTWLLECAAAEEPRTRRMALVVLSTGWPDTPETAVVLYTGTTDQDEMVRDEAVRELAALRSWV